MKFPHLDTGRYLTISFTYVGITGEDERPDRELCECLIRESSPNRTIVAVGQAVQHPKDRPNRIVGRKVALAHALQAAWPGSGGRDQRRQAWHAFFRASPRHK